jgi:glycerol-3-phosphate dehydrogenase
MQECIGIVVVLLSFMKAKKGWGKMYISFSAKERAHYTNLMANGELDLLVIGGGVTGAGIALDAQARGLKTGLVEMQDFAAGTSSRSTKLVHGGLRYLKQLEMGLVAEVGRERAIVYENAPHVTNPEWMLLPIIKGGTYGKWATSIGLKVYDMLARVKKKERRIMLDKTQTLMKEPLLRKDIVRGGGYYVEYRTDDARLTLEIIKEAVTRGAAAVNYTKVEELLYENGKVIGVKVIDQLTQQTEEIRARKVVNAAGPWADLLREKDRSKKGKHLQLTKGVHLVIDRERFPLKQAIYFDTPDKRMMFAIPRDTKTYIGTTDTTYEGSLSNPRMTVEDRDYILRATNFMFPELNLSVQDVESSWSGLRPLIHEEGKSPSELSRKDEIFVSESGLITIAGGKLTGYRKMAQRVVDMVISNTDKKYAECSTDRIPLSGGHVAGSAGFAKFLEDAVCEGVNLGLTNETEARTLVKRFGSNIDQLYAIHRRHDQEAKAHGFESIVFVTLRYAMEQEMAATPSDYFIRRTGALYFDREGVKRWQEPVTNYMASYLGWSKEVKEAHTKELNRHLHDAVNAIDR